MAVTLTGSPGDAIARTPIHCFVPRSQIKHSYGFNLSSACDNLYCRSDLTTIFITIVVPKAMGTLLRAASALLPTPGLDTMFLAGDGLEISLDTARRSACSTLPRAV